MKITLISGSAAEKSHTLSLLFYIKKILEESGVEVTLWNLRERPLPTVMPEYHKDPLQSPHAIVKEFVTMVRDSDGIVLGTPLYNSTFSGLLKSALDNLAQEDFRNKPVGLVSNGGGRSPVPLEQLRSVVRSLYGYTLQTQIATGKNDFEVQSDEFVLTAEDIKKRIVRFVKELIDFANLLKKHDLVKSKQS